MQVNDRNKNRRSIGLLALVSLLCHLILGPAIGIFGGHPNFALVFAGIVALSIGGNTGVAAGFAAGLAYDLTATSPVGLMALLCTCAAFGMGMEVRDRVADDPLGAIVPFSVASLAVSLIYHLVMLFMGLSESFLDALVFRTFPTTVLTILAYIPFALVVGRLHRGGGPSMGPGGTKLGGGVTLGSGKKLGSHYSLPGK